ncbi:hypothetical protein D910_12380, partial [Dendroctonus ponderosae]
MYVKSCCGYVKATGGAIGAHLRKPYTKRLLHQFEETGSVNYKNPLQGNRSLKMKKMFSRIIKKHNFYPAFCMWVLDKVAENEKFFENVLFSDECTFYNNGLVNRHNFHYYSDTNPRAYRVMKNQNRWSINVWGGILGQYLIGPYFFERHLNVSNKPSLNIIRRSPFQYENQHVASIGCSSASLTLRSSAIFKCQLSKQVNWQKWVWKLALQISGLNSTRFLFVGYIKGIVYHTLSTTSHDLKTRIRDAFKNVTPQMLSR